MQQIPKHEAAQAAAAQIAILLEAAGLGPSDLLRAWYWQDQVAYRVGCGRTEAEAEAEATLMVLDPGGNSYGIDDWLLDQFLDAMA